jgi:hypothetical protein
MAKPGDRVVVLMDTDKQHNYVLGRGVYVGDEVPTASDCAEVVWLKEFMLRGVPTPKIVLDDSDENAENRGMTVWGAEGWWATEEGYQTYMTHRAEQLMSLRQWRIDRPKMLLAVERAKQQQARQRAAQRPNAQQMDNEQRAAYGQMFGPDDEELLDSGGGYR